MMFYIRQSRRASMIRWHLSPEMKKVTGEGIIIWRKSFVVQRDSQGEGPEVKAFLTCLQNSKKFWMIEMEGEREKTRERRSKREQEASGSL